MQDLRTRTVSNWWNGLFGLAFLCHAWWGHTLFSSSYGMVVMGIVTFVPTWKGYFGVGDWKMGMVLGAASGFFIAGVGWILAMFIQSCPSLKRFIAAHSGTKLPTSKINTMPFALPMTVSIVVLVLIGNIVSLAMNRLV